MLQVYQDNVRDDADIDEAREAYAGTFTSKEDWAVQFIDDCGTLRDVPESLRNYFD